RFRARSKLLRVTHSCREPPSPFDRDGEIGLTDAGVDDVLDCGYVDAVPRGCLPVDLDVNVGLAGKRLGRNICRTWHRLQHRSDFTRPPFDLGQIAPI